MGILGLQPEVPQGPQGPVGQILTHEGYAKIALVDLGREVSDALRASWPARGVALPFVSAICPVVRTRRCSFAPSTDRAQATTNQWGATLDGREAYAGIGAGP